MIFMKVGDYSAALADFDACVAQLTLPPSARPACLARACAEYAAASRVLVSRAPACAEVTRARALALPRATENSKKW